MNETLHDHIVHQIGEEHEKRNILHQLIQTLSPDQKFTLDELKAVLEAHSLSPSDLFLDADALIDLQGRLPHEDVLQLYDAGRLTMREESFRTVAQLAAENGRQNAPEVVRYLEGF